MRQKLEHTVTHSHHHICTIFNSFVDPLLQVWDAFPFDSELDILDARLHELVSVVDYFVIVEAAYTFSGVQKPLYYQVGALQKKISKLKSQFSAGMW